METISNEEIMTMDVCKLRQLAREHKIPLDKCCNHNEWRERILLHRKKVLGTNFDIKVSNVVSLITHLTDLSVRARVCVCKHARLCVHVFKLINLSPYDSAFNGNI